MATDSALSRRAFIRTSATIAAGEAALPIATPEPAIADSTGACAAGGAKRRGGLSRQNNRPVDRPVE